MGLFHIFIGCLLVFCGVMLILFWLHEVKVI